MLKRKISILVTVINSVVSCLLFALFFPTLEIFGSVHEVPSQNTGNTITITEEPLFNLLSNDYYSLGLKSAYILLFVFQIISVLSVLLSIVLLLMKSNKLNLVLLISLSVILVTSILALSLFATKFPLNTLSIVLLVITLLNGSVYGINAFQENKARKEKH